MRIRTFVIIALVLAVLFGIGATVLQNGELFEQQVRLPGGFLPSVGLTLLGAFVLGVVVTLLFNVAREFGLMLERGRLRRAGRKAEEIEEDYSRGLVAVLEGREEEATRSFRAALERDSRHVNTLNKLGEVLRGQGKFAEAIEYHRKAQHLKPDSTRPLYALVEDYEAMGDTDRARTVLSKILALDKGSAAAWRKLRSLHLKDQNWEKALEAQGRIEKLRRPDRRLEQADRRAGLGIRYEIAAARLTEGNAKDAIAGFRRLLKDDVSFIPAHVGLGEALRASGNDTVALEAWHHGFEATGSPIFLTLLEEHHLQREQPLGAIEALKKCISGARKPTLPRFYLGRLYFRLEMLDDAGAVLASLEGLSPYAPTLHYLLGRIHERRNSHREAVQHYRKVIKEMELVQLDYACGACRARSTDWTHRCDNCGEWNTVEVNFREEITAEELGLAPAPIYTTRG